MSDFTDLHVWNKAHDVALDAYRVSAGFPRSETYGLQSQIRRSATSVATNLAEGSARSTNKDFARFVANAIGSSSELDYQLLLARDLGYVAKPAADDLRARVVEVRRMLASLRRHLAGSEQRSDG